MFTYNFFTNEFTRIFYQTGIILLYKHLHTKDIIVKIYQENNFPEKSTTYTIAY